MLALRVPEHGAKIPCYSLLFATRSNAYKSFHSMESGIGAIINSQQAEFSLLISLFMGIQ